MEEEEGLMGVTGREWCVYHVNTIDIFSSVFFNHNY